MPSDKPRDVSQGTFRHREYEAFPGIVLPRTPDAGDVSSAAPIVKWWGLDAEQVVVYVEDFVAIATSSALAPWLKATKVGTSTNNTVLYDVDALGGTFSLTHSADSEAQTMRLDSGDSLWINMSNRPVIEARLKINFAGATFSADQRFVFGFASDYAAALDDVTHNAWFRIEGAALDILAEVDDATTDDDDNDTGADIVDNTYVVLRVEVRSLSDVRFYVNGALKLSLAMAALPANSKVQPLIAIQRDAGAEVEAVTVDYIKVGVLR